MILLISLSLVGGMAIAAVFTWFRDKNSKLLRELDELKRQEDCRQQAEKDRRETDFMERFHNDVAIIAEAVKPLAHIGELQGMVEGLIEMTKATAAQVDSLNKIAEVLERSISPADPDYRDYAEDTEEGQERVNRSRMEQLMRKGVSPKEAADRIREQTIYDELIKGRR